MRELDAARKTLDTAARSIESALTAPHRADDEIRSFMEQLSSHAAFDAIRAQLNDRDADNQRLQAELERAQTDLKTARADIAQMTTDFEHALDDLRQEHATVIGEQAVAYASLPLDELLTVFKALGRSTTPSQVLMNLVNGLAREFSRVALFELRGNRLKGAQQVGFDFENDISKVIVPLSVDSLLSRAVNSGRLESFLLGLHGEAGASIPFSGTPTCALAIPIVLPGATVAVIYADDSDKPEFATAAPQARIKFAELLQQHALLVLLRVCVEQKNTDGAA